MRSASYYKGKARLAGILGIPFAILVMASGYVGYQYATSNITPATVSVSGYTRADATHVSAYNRRPRGSVVHDEPYEGLSLVSLIVFLGGAYFACRPIFRFIVMSPLSLLPPLDPTILPPQPIEHAVPVKTATARKDWLCEDCGARITAGKTYLYYQGRGAYGRGYRFCTLCATKRDHLKKELPRLRREYALARVKARREQCLSLYGLPPESLQPNAREDH